LEKLNNLRHLGVTQSSPMSTGVAYRCQTPVPYIAVSDPDYQNTIGNYIKRMLLVSDNNAYNRLYEFIGQRPLNERLVALGYPQMRIVRRFAPCDTAANRYTNPINFYNAKGEVIYRQPAHTNMQPFSFPLGSVKKGRAYRSGSKLINRPYDFTTANYLSLQDATNMLKAVLFPETLSSAIQFDLTDNDYTFLQHCLYSTPHSSRFKPYSSKPYFDTYKKYLYYGRDPQAIVREDLHIYNVVGMSHGYLTDIAYFADSTNHTEFMLSSVLYVNRDGVINDGAYEYVSTGLPFLRCLGQLLYQYEVKRSRQYSPDLTRFFSKVHDSRHN
jgi:hypothetical protein